MTIVHLYHTMLHAMTPYIGTQRMTRIRTLVWLQCGIMVSRSVHLTKVASKIPGSAKKLSTARRFRRFLDTTAVRVRAWYRPCAIGLLHAAYQATGHIRLIIDCSKVGNRHQLVMVAVATRRRALPIAWTWVRHRRAIVPAENSVRCWRMSAPCCLPMLPSWW